MGDVDFAELELNFTRAVPTALAPLLLTMRFRRAGSDADQVFPVGAVALDLEALRGAANTYDAQGRPVYGQALAGQLFAEGSAARAAFREYMALAAGSPLRLQVTAGPDCPELQGVVWEALRDPESGALLTTGERIWFSRYLYSQDSRPVTLRPRGQMRAVAAAASPADLAADPIDAAGELERAALAMHGIHLQRLPDGARRATLDNLTGLLRSGAGGQPAPDVLYLVCHGRLVEGASTIFLEDNEGRAAPLQAVNFAARLAEFVTLPRLVVLVACESAGPENSVGSGVMAALGPLLAQLGVPAVLAMHGRVSMATMARFLPELFAELQRDGQIDRAVAAARGAVREAFDAWMPVLFLRSRSGRLWLRENEAPAPVPDLFGVERKEIPMRQEFAEGSKTGAALAPADVQAAQNFAHLAQFVDRDEPYRHFSQNVAAPLDQRPERVLAFTGAEGMGKNWLLDRLEFECVRRGVRAARLELDDDAINSPLAILNALALAWGGPAAARWLDLDRVWRIGESGQSVEETPYAKNPQLGEQVLSEAFLKMLGELAVEGPLVLLFDSLDTPNLPEPTRRWLIDTLLDKARAVGGGGVLPVVSLSQPPDFSDRRWAKLEVHLYEHALERFDAGLIRQYLRLRGLPDDLIESRAQECLAETEGVPLRVASYARRLARAVAAQAAGAHSAGAEAVGTKDAGAEAAGALGAGTKDAGAQTGGVHTAGGTEGGA